MRESYIVSTSPTIRRVGLRESRTRLTVVVRWLSPSSAMYSHWIGMTTPSAAVNAFSVNNPSEGEQSSSTKS